MRANPNDGQGDPDQGKPLPPWRGNATDPISADDPKVPIPETIQKTVSTLASELRSLIFRDRRGRARRNR